MDFNEDNSNFIRIIRTKTILFEFIWIHVNLCENKITNEFIQRMNLYRLCGYRLVVRQCAALRQSAAVCAAVCSGSEHGILVCAQCAW
jgi:hypothetical protein